MEGAASSKTETKTETQTQSAAVTRADMIDGCTLYKTRANSHPDRCENRSETNCSNVCESIYIVHRVREEILTSYLHVVQ